jgi:hypothetical protein
MSADGNRILFDGSSFYNLTAATAGYAWPSGVNYPIIYDHDLRTLRKLPPVAAGRINGHPKLSRDGSRVIAAINPGSDDRKSVIYQFDVNTFPATWQPLAVGNDGFSKGVAISGNADLLAFFSTATNINLGAGRVDANFGPDVRS